MNDFLIGVDLGQAADYTAITVLEKMQPLREEAHGVAVAHVPYGEPVYHGRHLERVPLHTSYPNIVKRVIELVRALPVKSPYELVVDQTGVGRPVCDLFSDADLRVTPITITGGNAVSADGSAYSVPKRDLVSTLQVLMQNGRVKFADGLPEAKTLQNELRAFRIKVTLRAHDVYGSWREGAHDDLVLSAALAAWYGEHAASRELRYGPNPFAGYRG